ncbi:MAG: hypothetical protein ACYS1C_03970, partial [Planctomycetota bacterium]
DEHAPGAFRSEPEQRLGSGGGLLLLRRANRPFRSPCGMSRDGQDCTDEKDSNMSCDITADVSAVHDRHLRN